jgi:beta-lactamase class A
MRVLCYSRAIVPIFLFSIRLQAADAATARLEQQIEALAKVTDATVGVSAMHIESGRSVSVRGAEPFPMASAFKVPIAVQIMTMVDDGRLSLDKMVTLSPQDLHPGSGTLSELFFHPGVSLSVANLMELMLVISDNSAADLMLREAGGAAPVTARMRQLGLNGIRIDRNTAVLIADWSGVKTVPPEEQWNREMWDPLFTAVPDREHMAARRAETKSLKDTATPDDMTRLVAKVWRKELFSNANAAFLNGILERCQTGKARIKGMLPAGTDVAHKTGTLGGVANDTGIITLPNGAGHVAISVFTKGATRPEATSEKAIAEVSRTIYDYFLLVSPQ